mgnify:CR=1 FL=1
MGSWKVGKKRFTNTKDYLLLVFFDERLFLFCPEMVINGNMATKKLIKLGIL